LIVLSEVNDEEDQFKKWDTLKLDYFVILLVLGSAIIAFLLNVTNFFTNQTTSPLIFIGFWQHQAVRLHFVRHLPIPRSYWLDEREWNCCYDCGHDLVQRGSAEGAQTNSEF